MMRMTDVAIFGAGGLGCLVHDILLQTRQFRPVAFLDSDPTLHNRALQGIPLLGGLDALEQLAAWRVRNIVVAIGVNHSRITIAETLRRAGMRLTSAIHPLASISPSAQVG